MVQEIGENPAADGIDDRHEDVGHAFLADRFGPEVTEPVRLHVAAKRYLCGKEADYFAKLSRDSVLSLSLQGGPMDAGEIIAFESLPFWREAVRLRRYDEGAKVKGLETPPLAHFLPYVAQSLRAALEARHRGKAGIGGDQGIVDVFCRVGGAQEHVVLGVKVGAGL